MRVRHHKGLVWGGLVALVLGLGVSLVVLYAHRTTSSSPPRDGPATSNLPRDSVPTSPPADGNEQAAPTRHEYRTEVPAAEGSETEAPTRHDYRTELPAAGESEVEAPPSVDTSPKPTARSKSRFRRRPRPKQPRQSRLLRRFRQHLGHRRHKICVSSLASSTRPIGLSIPARTRSC